MRADDPEEPEAEGEAEEQDLLVVLRLSNRLMGVNSERQQIEAFADELDQVVTDAGVGEYDGDEIGGGECILFFCGPDIDAMLTVLQPHLKRSPLCRGGHLVRMVTGADGTPERLRIPL